MKLAQIIGVELEEKEIMVEIKRAIEQGQTEVRLGHALIKLPQVA